MRAAALAIATSLAIAAAGAPALGADLAARPYSKAPAMVVDPAYNWTGFYAGVNVGYGWGRASDDVSFLPTPALFGSAPFTVSSNLDGALGGAQAGYNWQVQRFVFGLEADIDAAGIKGSQFVTPLILSLGGLAPLASHTNSERVDWLGTARGRLGFAASDRMLLYATGGLAYGEVKTSSLTSFNPLNPTVQYAQSSTAWRTGWTAGAGGEWAFANNWSAKLEYLHYDLGSQTLIAQPLAPNPGFAVTNHFTTKGDIVRVGLNYRFAGSPVVAKY